MKSREELAKLDESLKLIMKMKLLSDVIIVSAISTVGDKWTILREEGLKLQEN